MKRVFIVASLTIMLALISIPALSETVDVLIKGVDDGVKTNKQLDYKEAVMNAKLQAIERAGVEIASITKVVNFKLKYDIIESKAGAVLLPGFQIVDIGYQTDGSYQVVLSGKIQIGKSKKIKGKHWGKLRSQLLHLELGKPGDHADVVLSRLQDYWGKYNPGTFKNQLVDNGDGTVTDWSTGLIWQQGGSEKMDAYDSTWYTNAINYRKFAGYSNWRIPTLEELASLIESKPLNGRLYIDPIFAPLGSLWSTDRIKEGVCIIKILLDRPSGKVMVDCLIPNEAIWGGRHFTNTDAAHVRAVRSLR